MEMKMETEKNTIKISKDKLIAIGCGIVAIVGGVAMYKLGVKNGSKAVIAIFEAGKKSAEKAAKVAIEIAENESIKKGIAIGFEMGKEAIRNDASEAGRALNAFRWAS